MTPFRGLLDNVRVLYDLPYDNLVGEVLDPAMSSASTVRIASGFFTSDVLAKVAPGLTSAIESGAQVQLLLSPELNESDWDAVRRGVRDSSRVVQEAVEHLLADNMLTSSGLRKHAALALSYLVAVERVEIRFVLMPRGMFHKKQWLISDGSNHVAIHGSGNSTIHGLFVNGEQMSIDRSWADGQRASARLDALLQQFELDWLGKRPNSITVTAEAAVRTLLERSGAAKAPRAVPPTVSDFWSAWHEDNLAGLEPELPLGVPRAPHRLRPAPNLEWRTGRYAHQGKAIDAFIEADARGILAIATGGGKTRTSLLCAAEYQDQQPHAPLLVVVLVPSDPLVRQWTSEIAEFGVAPTVLGDIPSPARAGRILEIELALASGAPRTEVVLATIQLFTTDSRLRELVQRVASSARTMLIADEAHNFGALGFISNPPEAFEARLGLSATPVRQYDLDGTNSLFDFLGPPVFDFSLAEAIASGCLVPYDYHVHFAEMDEDEMDAYKTLTEELYRAGFRIDDDGRMAVTNPKVESLLRRRRAVLEQTRSKIAVLKDVLSSTKVRRSLIYCSPKKLEVAAERQIIEVNRLLSSLGIVAHELTSKETSAGTATAILDRFAAGEYQALTAMKVLDEGVDVPATESAYLMASTTVEREWVQRRGRVLRTAPGKTKAAVHDFVALPPRLDDAGKAILRGEIRRLRAFAELAENQWDAEGPLDRIESLTAKLREK